MYIYICVCVCVCVCVCQCEGLQMGQSIGVLLKEVAAINSDVSFNRGFTTIVYVIYIYIILYIYICIVYI